MPLLIFLGWRAADLEAVLSNSPGHVMVEVTSFQMCCG